MNLLLLLLSLSFARIAITFLFSYITLLIKKNGTLYHFLFGDKCYSSCFFSFLFIRCNSWSTNFLRRLISSHIFGEFKNKVMEKRVEWLLFVKFSNNLLTHHLLKIIKGISTKSYYFLKRKATIILIYKLFERILYLYSIEIHKLSH